MHRRRFLKSAVSAIASLCGLAVIPKAQPAFKCLEVLVPFSSLPSGIQYGSPYPGKTNDKLSFDKPMLIHRWKIPDGSIVIHYEKIVWKKNA